MTTLKVMCHVNSELWLVQFLAEAGIFTFATTSRLALGHTQPPTKWMLENLFLKLMQPEYKTDQSRLRMCGSITPLSSMSLWHCA